MKPIRRKQSVEVTDNPVTGQEQVLEMKEESNSLSSEKSVDTAERHHVVFRDCGCRAPAFGRCYKCGAISCQAHHGICQKCLMPICLQCSMFLHTANQAPQRYCSRCYGIITGKQKLKKLGRFLLSPFIEMDNSNGR